MLETTLAAQLRTFEVESVTGLVTHLAALPKQERKSSPQWTELPDPLRPVVLWARDRQRAGKHLRSLPARVEVALRRHALLEQLDELGLPAKRTADNPYTTFGLRWWRRRLTKALLGLADRDLDGDDRVLVTIMRAVAQPSAGVTWTNEHRWNETFQNLARRLTGAADRSPSVRALTKVDWALHRNYQQYLAVAALVAADPSLQADLGEGIGLDDALTFGATGVPAALTKVAAKRTLPDGTRIVAASITRAVTGLLLDGTLRPKAVVAAAETLAADPLKATLINRFPITDAATLDSAVASLAGKGRFDATVTWGTLTDVATVHLAGSSVTADAMAVADLFGQPTRPAIDQPDAVAALRRISVRAVKQAVDAGVSGAHAVRLASTFGRRIPQALQVLARSTKNGTPVDLDAFSSACPVGSDAAAFGTWIMDRERLGVVARRNGLATFTQIGNSFTGLLAANEKGKVNLDTLSVSDAAAWARRAVYGMDVHEHLAAFAADRGYRPETIRPIAKRWAEALDTPSLFPLQARWADERSGLTARFLPRDDARGLFLGDLTDCCQYPGSAGQACAWAGHEHPSMGFFVVEDCDGEVVAQSWAWVDARGRLCFDSVERKAGGGRSDAARTRTAGIRKLYLTAAESLLDRFQVVTVGPAWKVDLGALPEAADDSCVADPGTIGYTSYRDSARQHILARRDGKDRRPWISGGQHKVTVQDRKRKLTFAPQPDGWKPARANAALLQDACRLLPVPGHDGAAVDSEAA